MYYYHITKHLRRIRTVKSLLVTGDTEHAFNTYSSTRYTEDISSYSYYIRVLALKMLLYYKDIVLRELDC
jgi:hypothetical protein